MSRPTSFAELGVPTAIVDVLESSGISRPFPIQSRTIPELLDGRDVIGRAPTGSGKTLAFGIPLVVRALEVGPAAKKRPTGLVLAPTRELAAQIADELTPLAAAVDRRVLAVYGGVGLDPQIKRLARGVDILVATPGRLEDLIAQRTVSLDLVQAVVVDEADRMADMGFLPAVRRLLDQTAPSRADGSGRQTVLYSATLDREVAKLTAAYQHDPARHEVGEATPDLRSMTHYFWEIPRGERIPLCASVIATFGRTIVFTRTRHGADRAARQLSRAGVPAVPIHGNRSQAQRQRALDDFAAGKAAALVATDVAARGIHVDAVGCVVHFDPPDEDSAYVHRSGRTARAGASGTVVSFVDPAQMRLVKAMKKRLALPDDITSPPGFDGVPVAVPDDDERPGRRPTPGDRPDRGRSSRPRQPGGGKRRAKGGRPGAGKPTAGRPKSGKPKSGQAKSGKPTSGKPKSGKPSSAKSRSGKPSSGKPRSGRPTGDSRRGGRPPGAGGSGSRRSSGRRGQGRSS